MVGDDGGYYSGYSGVLRNTQGTQGFRVYFQMRTDANESSAAHDDCATAISVRFSGLNVKGLFRVYGFRFA
jgi:hypothetical protein